MRISSAPAAPVEPELSPLPASMRLRMAKGRSAKAAAAADAERAKAREAAQVAAKATAVAQAAEAYQPLSSDPRGRITLPPRSERGSAPVFVDSAGAYDLLQDEGDVQAEEPAGLIGLVPDEPPPAFVVQERVPTSFGDQDLDKDVDASAWDDPQTDHNALFDIRRAPQQEEDLEEPPSELVGLSDLPRGAVIVKEERAADGFTHRISPRPLNEDAGVWGVEDHTPEPSKRSENKAWWEERTDDPPSASKRISALPGAKPKSAPSFMGKTRRERETEQRKKMARLGGIATLVILVIIGTFVWLSQGASLSPEHTPVMVEPLPAPPPQQAPPPELPALPPLVVPELIPEPVPEPEVVHETVTQAPLADPGFLNIRSEPGAVISIGRDKLGDSPIERLELPPGTYTIRAMRPGKRTKTRTVRVDSGRAQEIVFRW